MVRHVIYGAVVGMFIMKLVERFTMSFGEFVSASIEPCALMLHYGNTDRCCGVVRNDIVARGICSYMNRNYPNLAPNFFIDESFLDLLYNQCMWQCFEPVKFEISGYFPKTSRP